MISLITAKSAGFCAGVSRSVSIAEQALAQHGSVYCLGALVHNRDEVRRLEALGMVTVERPGDVPAGATVLLRAHGEGREVYEALHARGAQIVDTTCGKVERIQEIARNAEKMGKTLIVFGDPEHPEVLGTCGWCRDYRVVQDACELDRLLSAPEKLAANGAYLVFQSTQTKKKFKKNRKYRKKKMYKLRNL